MHGSASGCNVRYVTMQRENIRPSKKDINKAVTTLSKIKTVRCLQLGYESLRLLIADQQEVFRPPACSVLPPHCTKDGNTTQRSTCDLWTVQRQRSTGQCRFRCQRSLSFKKFPPLSHLKVHYSGHSSLQTDLLQMNPVYIPKPHFLKAHFHAPIYHLFNCISRRCMLL
jgi:hypothetical protein